MDGKGFCKNGDACPFRHGEKDKAALEERLGSLGGGSGGSSSEARASSEKERAASSSPPLSAPATAGSSAGPGVTLRT